MRRFAGMIFGITAVLMVLTFASALDGTVSSVSNPQPAALISLPSHISSPQYSDQTLLQRLRGQLEARQLQIAAQKAAAAHAAALQQAAIQQAVPTPSPSPTPTPAPSQTSSPPPAPVAPSGSPQDYAASQLGSYGWGQDQMNCLVPLWNNESGWNRFAENASGAYGIPQALPFNKMPQAAWPESAGGQSSATAQIDWGLGYIKSDYGNPCGAWSHEQATGWY